jgi:drug/metabolite transporter (DMT)-like permease
MPSHPPRNGIGIAFLVVGIFVFSFQDVIVKWVSGNYPVHQIVFIRSAVALPLVLMIVWYDVGLHALATRRIGLQMLRGFLAFTSYTSYYLALAAMPLADVVAINYSSPLLITLLSMVLLKEKVGMRRIGAVLVGFFGILLVTRPGNGVFEPAALLALLSAVAYGCNSLVARKLGETDSGAVMAFYSTLVYLGVSIGLGAVLWNGAGEGQTHPSLAFISRAWAVPTAFDMLLFVITGVIAAIGFYCFAQAYRMGEANVVAPFEYTGMIWAVILGYVVFAEIPEFTTTTGILLIVAAGLFVIYREMQTKQKIVTARGRLKVR